MTPLEWQNQIHDNTVTSRKVWILVIFEQDFVIFMTVDIVQLTIDNKSTNKYQWLYFTTIISTVKHFKDDLQVLFGLIWLCRCH